MPKDLLPVLYGAFFMRFYMFLCIFLHVYRHLRIRDFDTVLIQ